MGNDKKNILLTIWFFSLVQIVLCMYIYTQLCSHYKRIEEMIMHGNTTLYKGFCKVFRPHEDIVPQPNDWIIKDTKQGK